MSFPTDRGSRNQRSPRRAVRAVLAVLLSLGLLSVAAACTNDAQTLRPYTPAEGINVDVGNPKDPNAVVHVRNLLVISKEPGVGVISASIVTYGRDQLTTVAGVPIKIDGTDGTPFTADLGSTVTLANGVQVVLTAAGTPITVRSPDIAPGLSANLTLTFANAGESTVTVPIANGNEPQYTSISPAPAPSGTPA